MSSRVAGAGLALIAAALLAVSIATPVVLPAALSLFAGHPTVKDHTREAQDVYVGLYDAQLCNSGGDGTCKRGDAKGAFRVVGYGELGATGLGAFSLVMLGVLTLKKSESRKGAARLVRIANVIGVVGAGGMILLSPFGSDASVPIGLGMILHAVGLVGGIVASSIAVRPPPPLKLRVADRASQPVQAIPQPVPGFDMQAVFGDDALRPTNMAPPHHQQQHPQHQMPRGRRTDPPPFAGEPHGHAPAQPQLRPLYDATPLQGGTGGLMPFERPVLSMRAPTPVPRAMFEVDIDVEPSMIAPVPGAPAPSPAAAVLQQPLPPQAPPQLAPPTERAKSRTLPPPSPPPRSKPMTVPPPSPPPRASAAMADHHADHERSIASPPMLFPPMPAMSDGRPDAMGSPPNTEPTMFPQIDTPLAEPPLPNGAHEIDDDPFETAFGTPPAAPPPAGPGPSQHTAMAAAPPPPGPPRASQPMVAAQPIATSPPAPAAPLNIAPPPALPQPPRAHRESQLPPPPRAARETQAPKPGLRAAVPMPARPGRPTMPTRPPPLAMRGNPKTIAAPVVPPPTIPPIPAIPTIPSMPSLTMPVHDDTDAARVVVEISDNASQTNVSNIPIDPREPLEDGTSSIPLHAADGSDTSGARSAVRMPDTSPTGEPIEPLFAVAEPPAPAPPPRETAVAFPVPIAMPGPSPTGRDRPMPKLPISTAPDSLPPPKDSKQQAGPSPACPQCESPMAWVEEHLRFYCKSCRMYF